MPTYYTSAHRENYDSTSTAISCVVILKLTVVFIIWIHFDISADELNVHRHHTCTVPEVHAAKFSNANCCQYICILVAEIALILKKNNMKNLMCILNHKLNLQ